MPDSLELITASLVLQKVNPVVFRGYASGSDSLAAVADTLITVDTVQFDTVSGFNTATHLYTVQIAGAYRVIGEVRANLSSGQMGAKFHHNGTAAIHNGAFVNSFGGGALSSIVDDVAICAVGDTIALYAYSSAAIGTYASSNSNLLVIEYLGPA